ncbi:MAG: hypothetical protein RMI91_02140 [Gemmatales bacterium]|nr:hypothetical protein [Gemmatales bacterium]MDW7993427.1 hypothetical protein [Gemmatales bacterium]
MKHWETLAIAPGQTARVPCIVEAYEREGELAGQLHFYLHDMGLREFTVYVHGAVKGQSKQPDSKGR